LPSLLISFPFFLFFSSLLSLKPQVLVVWLLFKQETIVVAGAEECVRGRPRDSRSGDQRYSFIFCELAAPVGDWLGAAGCWDFLRLGGRFCDCDACW
jgi:hypothetical protein